MMCTNVLDSMIGGKVAHAHYFSCCGLVSANLGLGEQVSHYSVCLYKFTFSVSSDCFRGAKPGEIR